MVGLFHWRHPKLALQTPATLSLAKAGVSYRCTLDNYFNELELTLEVVTWKPQTPSPKFPVGSSQKLLL